MLVAICAQQAINATPAKPTSQERFSNIEEIEGVSFRRHVIPLASRLGCSSRECHGSFKGQGDFRLSLFGYDFKRDHEAMAGGEEPRINTGAPRKSLLLQKPTMEVKHKGKKRLDLDSWEYNVFLEWINSGGKNDEKETGEFEKLVVHPSSVEFRESGEEINLKVFAHWVDGTVEDVTGFTRFQSNDESVATVDKKGKIISTGPGDTHVIAFYDNGVTPVEVIRPWNQNIASNFPEFPVNTEVDRLILLKLQKLGIKPSEVCSDEDFLRRIMVDLTGSIPTAEEALLFIQNPSPNKRVAKIEELLHSKEYAAWWTTKLCDFTGNNQFQMPDRNFRDEFSEQWWEWIHKRIRENTPYNELIAGVVLGKSRESSDQTFKEYATEMSSYIKDSNPEEFADRETMPHFWSRRNIRSAEEKALSFSHSFLGVRIECAQCHKHPFDQWTKQDFDHFKAFFEPIRYGRNPSKEKSKDAMTYSSVTKEIELASGYDKTKRTNRKQLDQEIKKRVSLGQPVGWLEVFVDPRYGSALQKRNKNQKRKQISKRVLTPKILGGEEVMVKSYSDPRQPLMDWMEDPENPYFARSFVNRLWAHYFGRGLVEPADDLNLANPPSNEGLMRHLEKGFILSGFDMKWLHREILMSDAYQRSWEPNDSNRLDDKNYSHRNIKRLPAEVVYDGIQQATAPSSIHQEVAKRTIGPASGILNRNTRAGAGYSLQVFGKPKREINCDCERNNDPTLLQTIYTRNDPDMLKAIESGSKKSLRWIDELRAMYSPKRKAGGNASIQNQLAQVNRQLAKLRRSKPEEPAETSESELQKFKNNSKRYKKQMRILRERQSLLQSRLKSGSAKNKSKSKINSKMSPFPIERLITETFLRVLGRIPDEREFQSAIQDVNKMEDPVDGIKELLWALLNTKEFMVNH